MNERQYRDVLLAKAIETAPAHEPPLLDAAQRQAATEQALFEQRGTVKAGQERQLERLAVRRAEHLLTHAARQNPKIALLRNPGEQRVPWWWIIPLLALVLGFASEKITEPHRLNLLTAPLLAILAWNLAMYAVMLARALMALRRGRRVPARGAAPWTQWWSRTSARLKDESLRGIYQRFLQDWAPYQQARQARRLQAMLHLSAAALALGVVLGLIVTGLFTEYRIGWESTWLGAPQVHLITNLLSWPAQALLGQPAWSLEQIALLQSWPAGQQQNGRQWIIAYSLLLVLVVVLPRLLLALWHSVRAASSARMLHLPLDTAYFQALARDFTSDATVIALYPFSLQMTAQRQAELQRYVREQFGAAAHLHVGPTLEYADAGNYFRQTVEARVPSLSVLLFSLAATPEEEAHGAVLRQFEARVPGARAVWIYGQELAQRLGSDTSAQQRLAERRHLWQLFVQAHGQHAVFIDHAPTP